MSREDEVALSYIRDKAMLVGSEPIATRPYVILDPIRDARVVDWIRGDYERAKYLAAEENMKLIPQTEVDDEAEYQAEDEGGYAVRLNYRYPIEDVA